MLVISWSCLTPRIGSLEFLYQASRMTRSYIVDYTFGAMYEEWVMLMALDVRSCMRPSNDADQDLWTQLRWV